MIQKENYSLTDSEICIDGEKHVTYGIKGKNVYFEDVSTDRSIVEEMLTRLNSEQLEESQFMYFIEDETDK